MVWQLLVVLWLLSLWLGLLWWFLLYEDSIYVAQQVSCCSGDSGDYRKKAANSSQHLKHKRGSNFKNNKYDAGLLYTGLTGLLLGYRPFKHCPFQKLTASFELHLLMFSDLVIAPVYGIWFTNCICIWYLIY